MKVDEKRTGCGLGIADFARSLEASGVNGIFTAEARHDPFLPLAIAAEATERLEIGTCVAVAFHRSPMSLAQIGNDLQLLSEGRFILGIGTQVRPHIVRRFSSAWSRPVDRMREMVTAMRAIWRSWGEGTALDFRGEFYEHTLMTPTFDPGPNAFGNPRVFLAAVGQEMTEVAGEVGDGLFLHPFTTPEYCGQVTLASVKAGRQRSESRHLFEVSASLLVATGRDEAEMADSAAYTRGQLAFYASTPAYVPVLAFHGWEACHDELRLLARDRRWHEMPRLIDDGMLDALAIVAEPDQLATRIKERWGPLVDRVLLYNPDDDATRWAATRSALLG